MGSFIRSGALGSAWRRRGGLVAVGAVAVAALAGAAFERVGAHAIVDAPNAERAVPPPGPGERRVAVGPPLATLSVAVDEPRGTPRATVFVLHGIRDGKEHMLGWSARLVAAGYRVVRVDSRGHGRSTGRWLSYGVIEACDLAQPRRRARRAPADRGDGHVLRRGDGDRVGRARSARRGGGRGGAVLVAARGGARLRPALRTRDRAPGAGLAGPTHGRPRRASRRLRPRRGQPARDDRARSPGAHRPRPRGRLRAARAVGVARRAAPDRVRLLALDGATHETIAGDPRWWPAVLAFLDEQSGATR